MLNFDLRAAHKAVYAKALAFATAATVPGVASAQTSDSMVNAICGMIRPLIGNDSKMLALVFLIALAVMIFLWWMSENKEGVIVWVLRTGIAIGILINAVTIPRLVGLQPPC